MKTTLGVGVVACLGNREEQIQSRIEQNCRHKDRTSDLLAVTVDKICSEAEKKEDERTW